MSHFCSSLFFALSLSPCSVVENYSSSHAGGILAWGCSFFVSDSRIENVS